MITGVYLLLSSLLTALLALLDTRIKHCSFMRAVALLLNRSENMNIFMYLIFWGAGLAWAATTDYRLHKAKQNQS
jgi:hypothetical protein